MAITYVGGQTASITASTATNTNITFSLTGGLASTPAAGDFVVVAYSIGSTVTRTPAINTAGYTQLTALTAADSFDANLRVGYKRMGSTPDTQVQVGPTANTADSGFVTIHVFRGVDPTTPLDVTHTTATAANSGTPNPAAITPANSGNWIYVVGANGHGTTGTMTASYATAFLTGQNISTTNRTTMGAGYVTGQSAGVSYDPAAFTWSANANTQGWCAYTLALREEAVVTFVNGSATISASATTAAAGQRVAQGAATMSISAMIAANGDAIPFLSTGYGWSLYGVRPYGVDISYVDGAAAISASAAVTAAGQRIAEASAVASPSASVTAAGQRVAAGAATATVATTTTAAAQRVAAGAATAATSVTVIAAGQRVAEGAAAAAPALSVAAAGQRVAQAAATALPALSASATGQIVLSGAATASASATATADGQRVAQGSTAILPALTVAAAGQIIANASAQADIALSITARPDPSVYGSATISAQLLITATGSLFWEPGAAQPEAWDPQADQSGVWAQQAGQGEMWASQAANAEIWLDTTTGSTTWSRAV